MMAYAYDELYLNQARTSLARMLDYTVNDLGFELEDFWKLFLTSGVAKKFGEGDCSLIAGRSGVEIAYIVLENSGIPNQYIKPKYPPNRSREYWTGWAIAWYQWKKGLSFEAITALVPISDIRALYDPYHEMDIRQFEDRLDEECKKMRRKK